MKEIDYLTLDGRAVKTFLIVLEENSVSKAAVRLGVTQSAVSHTLDKLRSAWGDELFVRAGRGIEATEHARNLEMPARALLDGLQAMTHTRKFDPGHESMSFTVAANDFQREMVFPSLMRSARKRGIALSLRLLPSGQPTATMLREERCDFIVSPYRPEGNDIYQTRLFNDELGCCYDRKVWKRAPTMKQLQACDYVSVNFGGGTPDGPMPAALADKSPVVTVANFAGVVSFIQGTDLVSIQPKRMGRRLLKPLAVSSAPFKTKPFSMYLLWHKRNQTDPAHRWLRNEIQAVSAMIDREALS
ncbi:MAG: LysR family transcriptional regulator [Burkholderiaceae bacterium]